MTTVSVAYILLEDARLPDEEALIQFLRVRHADIRWNRSTFAPSDGADGPLFIRAGDHLMTILLMPAPIPFDQQLWERASWLWPEAFHAARRHRAHLVVAPMGSAEGNTETKALDFAENTYLTTAFVGAVVAALPNVVAVIWDGKIGRSPEMWLEQSSRAFEAYPDQPFGLWMDIVPFRSGKTLGAYTLGLSAFAGREIEFEVDGLDERTVTGRVAQLSAFLIAADPDASFKNGEVFKPDSEIDHRVAVLHRKSRFNLGPVISFSSLDDRSGRIRTYPIIPPSIAGNHPLLIMLAKVGHFDPAHPRNKIGLKPDHYVSEVRLESFDEGLAQALSRMIATDTYAEADINARSALARGDMATAKSILQPWADEVGQLQGAVMLALMLRDLHMFAPAPHRSP
ncbi:hypothetical protein I6F14_03130 [Bradyrhizobium sp. IC3069]|nr:hypothetical protein [Bradyrhizobium sp. IC4059]MCA1372228.1 hypothetical protein [Bradyrhizobium sp. IC4060]MCA1388743.1 hypothetical protein [Bradyrhizobium sp. IC3123]MCA1432880.1 hypothetical protein [Bradyrhizobium sp. BRP20]MCA1466913.1 hypothetical protein [Bradyrhizobium sp. IC3195]MCA1474846.1 hypothetical protein [Bradyrhizobium sp. NBAIM08]MCA1482644.1 hypothetical protein [Bradyrhizobium sp. IC4061]MCA1499002.1 hypothetical protein [Bradyrhizobium sp. NBAIM14]MCA1513254.1 hyp